jgi:putative sigma-54 modulation protein
MAVAASERGAIFRFVANVDGGYYSPFPALGRAEWGPRQRPDLEFAPLQVNISARHGHLSEASQEKIRAKVDKLNHIFNRLTAIEVTVNLEHEETPQVDLRVSAEHKHDFAASDQSDSLMASIDNAVHKLEQQLRKYKEKIQNRGRTPGNFVPAPSESNPETD